MLEVAAAAAAVAGAAVAVAVVPAVGWDIVVAGVAMLFVHTDET